MSPSAEMCILRSVVVHTPYLPSVRPFAAALQPGMVGGLHFRSLPGGGMLASYSELLALCGVRVTLEILPIQWCLRFRNVVEFRSSPHWLWVVCRFRATGWGYCCHMRVRSKDGTQLTLAVHGCELPNPQPPGAYGWDANWLIVSGDLTLSDGRHHSFMDTCLMTWEAAKLHEWLQGGGVWICPRPGAGPDTRFRGALLSLRRVTLGWL
ncbi:WapI family immunity protein [Corynebacterium sp. H128]|uniref:WapI family immunity protein n=1 Tax=Corynebacterium sp. H128 TaxID=3133427 RepID=UPI00403F74CE